MKAARQSFDGIATSVRPDDEAHSLASTDAKLRSAASALKAAGVLVRNINVLFRMVRDGSFHMSWASRGMILAALLYFVMPIDATPDIIPIVGYLDDSVVVGMVIKRLAAEIARYKSHISLT
jgi:uncharacterized membrane protein YkvA (DUF1232 family)